MNKKWVTLTLKIAVSVALIWFLFSNIDIVSAKDRLLDADPTMLVLSLAVLTFQLVINTKRWDVVLAAIGERLSFLKTLQIVYIGIFFNQTLPSSVGGDAVRIYRTYHAGVSLSGSINGIMLERAAGVIALILLVLATQPFFLPRVGDDAAAWMLPVAVMFTLASVAGLGFLMILDRLPSSLRRWRLVRGLAMLAADTRKVFLNPVHAFKALGWSAFGHLNLTFGVYIMSLGIGLGVTWIDCIALIPPVILVTTLPISIAGWGVREGAMVAAFGLIGTPAEGALALSLLFGLVAIVTSLPGGLIWLYSGGMREGKDVDMVAAESDSEVASSGSGGPAT